MNHMAEIQVTEQITRCFGSPVMSATVKRNVRLPSESKAISVDDVYVLAERERARSSYRNRCHVLEQAQKDVRRDEGISRPHSSASHLLHKRQSYGSSQHHRSRMNSAHSTVKPNTPDNDVEIAATFHCCDIMGPSVCQSCRKANSRASSRERADASFPSLRVTQQNITTSAIVKRLYPDMSNIEIHTKIARGEIARSYLPKALRSGSLQETDEHSRQEKIKQNEKMIFTIARMKHRLKNRGAPTTPMFFQNIRDLNFKIMSGLVPRELGFDKLVPTFVGEKKIDEDNAPSNSLFPVFVSPRKVTMFKEPSYKTYFSPPLLPRESQKPEPSFFAGSNQVYRLPERLPDKLVFIDGVKGRLNSAVSHASVISDDTLDTETPLAEKEEGLD